MDQTRLDIVFTAPHPDDLEIGMGGAIARMVKLGYRVGMVHMTNGEPTPRGTPETRLNEMRAAAEVLGAQVCEMLHLPNRELMDVTPWRPPCAATGPRSWSAWRAEPRPRHLIITRDSSSPRRPGSMLN